MLSRAATSVWVICQARNPATNNIKINKINTCDLTEGNDFSSTVSFNIANATPILINQPTLRSQIIFPFGHFGQYIDSSSSSADPVEGPASRIFVTLAAPPLSTSHKRSSILVLYFCLQAYHCAAGLPFTSHHAKTNDPWNAVYRL